MKPVGREEKETETLKKSRDDTALERLSLPTALKF